MLVDEGVSKGGHSHACCPGCPCPDAKQAVTVGGNAHRTVQLCVMRVDDGDQFQAVQADEKMSSARQIVPREYFSVPFMESRSVEASKMCCCVLNK